MWGPLLSYLCYISLGLFPGLQEIPMKGYSLNSDCGGVLEVGKILCPWIGKQHKAWCPFPEERLMSVRRPRSVSCGPDSWDCWQ